MFYKKSQSSKGESSKGESSKGESSKGESSKGVSSKRESSKGVSSKGVSSKREIKKTKFILCNNTLIITPFGKYITNNINYKEWEKNNNFRKWILSTI